MAYETLLKLFALIKPGCCSRIAWHTPVAARRKRQSHFRAIWQTRAFELLVEKSAAEC